MATQSTPTGALAQPTPISRATYCNRLAEVITRYLTGDEADELRATLESFARAIGARRDCPGLNAATYDLLRRYTPGAIAGQIAATPQALDSDKPIPRGELQKLGAEIGALRVLVQALKAAANQQHYSASDLYWPDLMGTVERMIPADEAIDELLTTQ